MFMSTLYGFIYVLIMCIAAIYVYSKMVQEQFGRRQNGSELVRAKTKWFGFGLEIVRAQTKWFITGSAVDKMVQVQSRFQFKSRRFGSRVVPAVVVSLFGQIGLFLRFCNGFIVKMVQAQTIWFRSSSGVVNLVQEQFRFQFKSSQIGSGVVRGFAFLTAHTYIHQKTYGFSYLGNPYACNKNKPIAPKLIKKKKAKKVTFHI